MNIWQGYNKGVNLGGWLSQCQYSKEHFDTFITERDIEIISRWNVDHVRVPVDYNIFETENGDVIESGYDYIGNCIKWCRQYKLNMILDLHKAAGYSFDEGEKESGFFESEKYQERFYSLWERLAKTFGSNSDMLAFELLNEVVDRSVCDKWNSISYECIKRIRKYTPDIKILVGGYWNNSVMAVKDLAAPYDNNIVYNFHCYDPLVFTHQGAYWIPEMPSDFRCNFEGTLQSLKDKSEELMPTRTSGFEKVTNLMRKIGPDYFLELFKEAYETAEKAGISLYCGEYGVIGLAEEKEAARWFSAIHQAFDYYHIGRAAWNYKLMDFDISGKHMEYIFE